MISVQMIRLSFILFIIWIPVPQSEKNPVPGTPSLEYVMSYIENREIEKAMNLYLSILDNYEPDSVNKCEIYRSLSRLYEMNGSFKLAIKMHLNAVNFITDSIMLMSELASISNVYVIIGDYEKAKNILKAAILFFIKNHFVSETPVNAVSVFHCRWCGEKGFNVTTYFG